MPAGIWHPDEYAKLVAYDADTGDQPMSLFQCHQNDAQDDQARLCAGWVGCHGDQLLSLRVALAQRRIDASVFDYTTDVPLFGSGAEAAEHGLAGVEHPDTSAVEAIHKITRRRADLTW